MSDDTGDAAPRPVAARTVLLSAVGVWLFYFVVVTARSFVTEGDIATMSLGPRALVSVAGVAVTLLLWLVLQRLERRSLGLRIAAILLLALPAALGVAFINHRVFSSVEINPIVSEGMTRVEFDKDGTLTIYEPGAAPRTIRNAAKAKSIWQELTDVALGRYFLFIAWGALYLAFANAEVVRAGERREAALRRAAKSAELRSLRYQVNPHFLFNTLNSLSALVMTGRKEDAEAMIQTLSGFYRATLAGDPTADATLGEEVALQRLYLDIEAIRFPQRLVVSVDVPDALADICVPGLILQPLVENAVKHGVAGTTRPVTVTIRALIADERLHLTVKDDGGGGAPAVLGCGIGLQNVRDRLTARFGNEAQIAVDRRDTEYAVTLAMPINRDGC